MEDSKKHFFSLLFLSFSSFRVTFRYICVFLLVSALFFLIRLIFGFRLVKIFKGFTNCCFAAARRVSTSERTKIKKLWENSKKLSREKRGENLLSLNFFLLISFLRA